MKYSYRVPLLKLKTTALACAVMVAGALSSCTKQNGYITTGGAVTKVIQINVNTKNYSISQSPGVISFSTTKVDASIPHFREFVIKGVNNVNTVSFSLSFSTDSLGSGIYNLEGSQFTIGTKTYFSLAAKSTDKINVTKLDLTNNLYTGTFSFYAYNQSSTADSALVTGTYSIQ